MSVQGAAPLFERKVRAVSMLAEGTVSTVSTARRYVHWKPLLGSVSVPPVMGSKLRIIPYCYPCRQQESRKTLEPHVQLSRLCALCPSLPIMVLVVSVAAHHGAGY